MEKNIHGFQFVRKEPIVELKGEGFEYVHEKTKAKLFFLKTDDQNKAFAIGFRTPPHDSTGVPHIIEHSVLCGSDKFTTKEPFVNLMKGSLNTFLNAMTSPDKTIYPFSTQNLEDYKNMLNIYVDAVFNPKMRSIKEIFMQEGWHYELENKDAPLTLNGVVYNEMKGAYSVPESVLDDEICKALFDSCYCFSSGGDPDVIPSLTYEDFLAFHSKYYHPSNSCIYVYGDIDVAEIMEILDGEYLSKYDYKEIDSEIHTTKPFDKEKFVKASYSIEKGDSEDNKTYAGITYVIEDALDSKIATAVDVLSDVLFNSDSACIKTKILADGLCQDMVAYLNNYVQQPTLNIILQNTTEEKARKAFDIIENSLAEFAENGLDKKLVNSCILNSEFKCKEYWTIRTGRGVNLSSLLMENYFHGVNPFDAITFNDDFTYAKALKEDGGFEKLIKKYLVDNQFKVKAILVSEQGLAERKAEKLAEKLAEYKKTLSDEEITAIMEADAKLKLRQRTPDSPEDLKTIPTLKVSQIEKNIPPLSVSEDKKDKFTLYHYDSETNGIVYGRMMFDASVFKTEELPYLGFICNALSMMPTENYTVTELPSEIMENMGELTFTATSFADFVEGDKTYKFFEVNFKALEEKLPKAGELIREILFKTDFTHKDRLKQILNMVVSRMQTEIISIGHIYGMLRAEANFSETSRFMENIKYYTYYAFVKDIMDNFEAKAEDFIGALQAVLAKAVNGNNVIVSVAGNSEVKAAFEKEMDKICGELKTCEAGVVEKFAETSKKEGFMTTSNVQYVSMGYNFKKLGYKYEPQMEVLNTILSTDYLWNNIRVLGGAYGAPFMLDKQGNFVFSSFRDPNLENSLKVYREAGDYITNLKLDETEFNNYIIGTMQTVDAPKTAAQKCVIAINNRIAHITDKDRQDIRDGILSAKLTDINKYGEMMNKIAEKSSVAVFGNANKVKENEKIFDEIIQMQ